MTGNVATKTFTSQNANLITRADAPRDVMMPMFVQLRSYAYRGGRVVANDLGKMELLPVVAMGIIAVPLAQAISDLVYTTFATHVAIIMHSAGITPGAIAVSIFKESYLFVIASWIMWCFAKLCAMIVGYIFVFHAEIIGHLIFAMIAPLSKILDTFMGTLS